MARHVQIDPEAVMNIAAAHGIDSVSELARRAELDQGQLSRIVRGERLALPSHVLRLASALAVKPSALLDPSESKLGESMDATYEEVAS